jgi:hypothetical protein
MRSWGDSRTCRPSVIRDILRGRLAPAGGGEGGAVRLTGTHIGGSLMWDGASLRNDSGPALVAYGLEVGQSVFLRRGFTVTGAGERGRSA